MSQPAVPRDESSVRKVLRAEEEARSRIAATEQQAADVVEAARADARRIESEAVERANAFQASCSESAEQKVRGLRQAAQKRLAEIEEEQLEPRIRDAAERIAHELIRLDSGGGSDAP